MTATTETIRPETTMQKVLEIFPGAQQALFRRYHIGGCSSCGFQPDETLAGVCARNNSLPVGEVVEHILTSHEQDLKMQIGPVELAAALKDDPNGKLVDVRTREEYDAVHV